jgi:uracil-DNA glycosylase
MEVKIEPSWKKRLGGEFEQQYFKALTEFVKKEYKEGVVYPAPKNIFRAFDLCPFDKVKVVILGQDPYHGIGQANGLAFAVDQNVAIPPSLQNVFKEIRKDIGGTDAAVPFEASAKKGDLSRWAEQGVLLLNATLTVRASNAGSHQGKGWEQFTDAAIRALSEEREHLVFMLWGNYAKAKGAHIDRTKHLVLEAAHPSPFSAYSGFFGCKHFSKANEYLTEKGERPVAWD